MIHLASWIIGSLVVAGIAAWVIALPGTLTLELAGYRLQPRLGTAVVILLAAATLVILTWAIMRRIIGAPRAMARRRAGSEKNGAAGELDQARSFGRRRDVARGARNGDFEARLDEAVRPEQQPQFQGVFDSAL